VDGGVVRMRRLSHHSGRAARALDGGQLVLPRHLKSPSSSWSRVAGGTPVGLGR
jgi:hypothetical protein